MPAPAAEPTKSQTAPAALPAQAEPAAAPAPAAPSDADRAAWKALRDQGDGQMKSGDISTARLFYQMAADKGDPEAALRLGNSYDPAFLKRLGVLGMRGDVAKAASWYRRAQALGNSDAARALAMLPQ
jgi:TPR repeat protein